MGVGEDGNVGDGVGLVGEEWTLGEVALEGLQGPPSAIAFRRYQGLVRGKPVRQRPVTKRPDVGLDVVLLEEQPLHDLRLRKRRLRQVLRAAGEEAQNRIRFRNVRSEERRVGKECRSRWSPYDLRHKSI